MVVAQKGSHVHLQHPSYIGRVTVPVQPEQDGGYFVTVPALPGCFTRGSTAEECQQRAVEAIEVHLDGLPDDAVPDEVEAPRLLSVTVAA